MPASRSGASSRRATRRRSGRSTSAPACGCRRARAPSSRRRHRRAASCCAPPCRTSRGGTTTTSTSLPGLDGGTTAAILPRIPNFAAYQATPAAGGVALPIPADTDIVLRSTAKGGTLAGTTLLRGPANVTEDVVVVLRPTDGQPATPISLPWDASHPATVNVPQPFEFAGAAGARIVVTVTPLIGEVLLQRVGGPTVAMASGDIAQAFAFLNAVLPSAGQYRLIVTPASGQTFRLVVRGLVPTQGTQLTLPVVRDESISQGDVDQFRFNGNQGATPLITVERTGSSTATGRVLLLAPDGQQIADVPFGATRATLSPTLPATGSYGIVVVSAAGGGGYRLSASTPSEGATPISIPHDASYTLDANSEADEYTFQGTAGDPVFVTVERTSGSTARGSVTLLAPGAGALAARDFNSNRGHLGVVLSEAGEFRIRVLAIAKGGYRLQVARSGAFPLVIGTSPANGATGVAPAAPITVTFIGDIQPTSAVGGVTVTVPGFTVPGTSSATGPTVTFAPTEPLPPGVLVTVRLETTIRQVSPNGTLPAVATFSFRTADVLGAGSSLGEGFFTTVAVDPGGGAVALFQGRIRPPTGFSVNGVGTARYTPGVGWDSPTVLRAGDSANVSVPRIAMNGSGNAVAVFLQEPGGGDITSHVYAAVYTPAGGFAAPERIENVASGMGGTQNQGPEVAIDDSGNAVAAWFEDAPTHRLLGNRHVAGVGWGQAVALHPDPPAGTSGESVHVASNGTGAVAVGYITGGKAYVRRYIPATEWVDAAELGTANRPLRVAVDAAGNMLAVYRAGLQYNVRRFDVDDGVWAAVIPLDASTLGNTVDENNLDLAMAPSGAATLVYSRTEPGQTFTLLARRFTPDVGAGAWSTASPIDGPSATEPVLARVRVTPAGAAVAAWWRGVSASVPATRRYDPAAGWSASRLR